MNAKKVITLLFRFQRLVLAAATLTLSPFNLSAASDQCFDLFDSQRNQNQMQLVFTLSPGPNTKFKMAGTVVYLKTSDQTEVPFTFLGRMVGLDGKSEIMLLKMDGSNEILLLTDENPIKPVTSDGQPVSINELQPQIKGFAQTAWTCAGTACFNALRALNEARSDYANEILAKNLKTLEDRFALFGKLIFDLFGKNTEVTPAVINEKIIELSRQYGLKYTGDGKAFNLAYESFLKKDVSEAEKLNGFKKRFFRSLEKGFPIVLFYTTSDNTFRHPFRMKFHRPAKDEPEVIEPAELYVPNLKNEKIVGAHAVTVTGYVDINGKRYLIFSDPNETRVQFLPAEYLDRVFSANMLFWTFYD